MATPEVYEQAGISEPETSTNELESLIDPIELAVQALAKLKEAGHSGVLYEQDFNLEPQAKVTQITDAKKTSQINEFKKREGDFTPEQMSMLEHFYHLPEAQAKKIIKNWMVNPEAYEDAVGAGYIGLVKAIKKFDTTKINSMASSDGVSYIILCVKGEILRSLRDKTYKRSKEKGGESIKL